eukprot:TRINITY_DN4770_c1_g2_i1.p1 TRINITY_DN4770_c1_g2~~TRINITY_DN4770_c1_g2_i1.p1  ORF type:complete len:223 (+),score=37.71 TRINITY_DN4770_c1_g2_i1:887-1555(+)
MVQDDVKQWGFLGIEWANIAAIDLESESYRWLGPLRFDIKGAAKVLDCESYKGRVTFRVEKEWNPKNPLKGSNELIVPETRDGHLGPYKNYFENKDENEDEWKVIEDKFSFFHAGNIPKVMVSPGPFCPHAKLNDGTLDLIFARELSRSDLTVAMLSIEDGTFASLPFVEYYKTRAFILEPDNSPNAPRAPIGIDGEHTANTAIKVQVHQALVNLFYDFPHH